MQQIILRLIDFLSQTLTAGTDLVWTE